MKIIYLNSSLVFRSNAPLDPFDYISSIDNSVSSTEWSKTIVDSQNRILWGLYLDSTEYTPSLAGLTVDGVSVQDIVNAVKAIL